MFLGVPALEDIDPTRVYWIGCLHEVKASSRLTGLNNNVRVRSEEGCSVSGVQDQATGDDQHEPNLGG